jgi:hypothetical protein
MITRFGIALLFATAGFTSQSFAGNWVEYYPGEFAWQAAPEVVEWVAEKALYVPSYVSSPYTLYQGVQGWQQTGWEAGRWIETYNGNPDPGDYQGFYSWQSWGWN